MTKKEIKRKHIIFNKSSLIS